MRNEIVFKKLIDGYNELAFTHDYIFGFIDRGNVYMAISSSDMLPFICKLDKASRGAGYSLRFKPTKTQKELLKTEQLICLGSEAYFNNMVANSKYNKGEIFEKMVTEYYGQAWTKDSVPFTEDGDLTVNEIAYQIKFQGATFTNEKTLANMMK